jgi:hypothetical protein
MHSTHRCRQLGFDQVAIYAMMHNWDTTAAPVHGTCKHHGKNPRGACKSFLGRSTRRTCTAACMSVTPPAARQHTLITVRERAAGSAKVEPSVVEPACSHGGVSL